MNILAGSSKIPCSEIKSVDEFIQKVNSDTAEWKFDDKIGCPWFRGQDNAENGPIPSVLRKNYDEFWLTTTFRNRAQALGQTPESNRLDKWLFLMQHFRLPTRLLDWTESSLVALYFAVNKLTNSNPAVWVINPIELNKISIKAGCFPNTWVPGIALENFNIAFGTASHPSRLPIAIQPTYVHLRMLAQKSCFTIHGTEKDDFETLFQDTDLVTNGYFRKYIINRKNSEEILNVLKTSGITDSVLFPDFEGLALELKNRFLDLG